MAAEHEPLLTMAEAAEFLGCSRRTVCRMIADGQLVPIKVRSLNRFTRKQLADAFNPAPAFPARPPATKPVVKDHLSSFAARSACDLK